MATPSSLTCLCGLINEPASLLPSASLPYDANMCHCNICRQTTGALSGSYIYLKGPPSDELLNNATAYKTSTSFTRFFCKRCGCNVFVRCERDGAWVACAGVIDLASDQRNPASGTNVSEVLYHEHVSDATDGGIATFLTKLGERDVPCYPTDFAEKAETMQKNEIVHLRSTSLDQPLSHRDDNIEVACYCGGVQLRIAPPSYNETSEGWYVPADNSKYYARLCCCRSCRLALGFSHQPWTYVPPSHIYMVDGTPVVFGPKAKDTVQIEKLKYYQSSESVLRSFCSTCGATMFYQSFERPYIINVSVGVLRSKVGNVLAGEWLHWDRTMVSKRHEAVDDDLIEAWLGG